MKYEFKETCQECGGLCCRKGTPIVLPKERDMIIEESGLDVFVKKEDYYTIPYEPCPFLTDDNLCSINEIKPLDCKSFPIGMKDNKWFISTECPLVKYLNKDKIELIKKEFLKIPIKYREAYVKVFEESGFKMKEL